MIVYIAGKITGASRYRKKFKDAENQLKNTGHITLNPAILPNGIPYESCMKICFTIIDQSDAVYFLSDWKYSDGAKREYEYAIKNNKAIMFQ